MKVEKYSTIKGVLICCILCGITLFVSSHRFAAAMCPVRFMPLYELAKLYEAANRKDEALAMAQTIIDKHVKVPSPSITVIKNEMKRLIEAQEMTDGPENDNRTSDESTDNDTRQGETPEQGAALPP